MSRRAAKTAAAAFIAAPATFAVGLSAWAVLGVIGLVAIKAVVFVGAVLLALFGLLP